MDDIVKQILEKPIQLADQVIKAVGKASFCNEECDELKSMTEKLAELLRQAARESSMLHERPTRRIIQETEQVLYKAPSLVNSRVNAVLMSVFPTILVPAFRKASFRLQDSIGNVSWLLRVFVSGSDYLDLVKPSISAKEPVLCIIWKQIAILYNGSLEDCSNAAASLLSIASNDDSYGKLIIEEGGVSPLLNLLKEGNMEAQRIAAHAIGLLGRDSQNVEHMIHVGMCSVFAKILEEGPMNVQAVVALVVSELAERYPKFQDLFTQHNIVKLLLHHLALLTAEESSKYEYYNVTRFRMKECATRALCFLAKGNSLVCRSIADSKAFLCFAVLLETVPEAVRYNSAMAVMEITAVAEKDPDLREYAFDPNSPAFKPLIDQVLTIIEKSNSNLLIPCIKTVGNLARATTETRMIDPLVKLLHMRDRDTEVHVEALIALTKYACTENEHYMDNSKAILSAGGAECLIHLVNSGEHMLKIPAVVLLSYIALHVPHSEKISQVNVILALELASQDSSMTHDDFVHELLRESKSRLELSSMFLGLQ